MLLCLNYHLGDILKVSSFIYSECNPKLRFPTCYGLSASRVWPCSPNSRPWVLIPSALCMLRFSQLLQFSASLPVPVTSTSTSAPLSQPNPAAPQLPQTSVLPTHQNPLLPSSHLSGHLIMDPMRDSASGPSAW